MNLMNYFKIKTILYKHYHMQSSEIENMPFYEIEYTLDILKDEVKQRNEQEKNQRENYSLASLRQSSSLGKGINLGKSINIPKMPKMPRMPKF